MKILFVRHGETNANKQGISQGQGVNESLNKQGKIQAKKLALRLKKEKFDIAYTSDLKRAKETADEIMTFHKKVKLIVTKALREKHHGLMEGKPHLENKRILEGKDFLTFKAGGESIQETQERALRFFHEIWKKNKNKLFF
ncbi:histidine phosphatase family protein [Candidatus Woesearchaeota archaeon]|nr:histidine phosphatase family protein [Candidatus Woesearchaeota archaeon]